MAKDKKISNKEFWALLRENAGLYARTARAIQKQFNISYTRQAVKIRAEGDREMLNDILDENIDVAEEGIHSLMRSKDERVKMQAVKFYLSTIGKKRGYIEKSEVEHSGEIKTGFVVLPSKIILDTNSEEENETE